jgi:hypothetical protein
MREPRSVGYSANRPNSEPGRSADHGKMTEAPLDVHEDAELRRLHVLRGFGMVAGSISSRYDALRGRDRRKAVREPDDDSVVVPVETSAWDERQPVAAPRAPSAPQRVVSDTREIFGQRPEPRRGLGIFRR